MENDSKQYGQMDFSLPHDVVTLPSGGKFYASKKKNVKIGYLTAADENILAAPNLIQTNQIVTELLKRKVLDRDMNVDDLIEEDKQAILIFLRNTAFGTEYKLTLNDPKTDKTFDIEVDLSNVSDSIDFPLTILRA